MTLAYTSLSTQRQSRLALAALVLSVTNPLFFLAAREVFHAGLLPFEAASLLLAVCVLLPSCVAAYLALFAFLRIRLTPQLCGIPSAVAAGFLSLTWPNLVAAYYFLPR
jgi:hypothetical protein